jgi:hypothetical protein
VQARIFLVINMQKVKFRQTKYWYSSITFREKGIGGSAHDENRLLLFTIWNTTKIL